MGNVASTFGSTLRWENKSSSILGELPPMWGHSAVIYKGNMFVWGGFTGEPAALSTELYELKFETFAWKKHKCKGTVPPARWGHSAVVMDGDKMIVFGGRAGDTFFNTLYSLNLETLTWTQLVCGGEVPTARCQHSAIVYSNGDMYICGGCTTGGSYLQDVYSFNFSSQQWTKCNPGSSSKSTPRATSLARAGHAAVLLEDMMYIIGGTVEGGAYSNDIFCLDIEKGAWQKVPTKGTVPSKRTGACAVVHAGSVYLFGGETATNTVENDFYKLTLGVNDRGACVKFKSEGLEIPKRTNHSYVVYCGGLFVLGGRGEAAKPLNDLWYLNLDELDTSWMVSYKDIKEGTKLGDGANGIVYRGTYKNNKVAIKKLKDLDMEGENSPALMKFKEEIQIMRKLRHPNIVEFKCACQEAPNFCMVLEFCEGGELRQLLSNTAIELPMKQKIAIAKDIAKGMAHLHMQTPPVVHRDLKPENILFDKNGRAKISDFGASRFSSQAKDHKGTPFYLSPEVIQDEPASPASDVYAYAMILWEILTRKKLYDGRQMFAIQHKVVNEGLRPDLPDDDTYTKTEQGRIYIALMKRCWDADPKKRPSFIQIIAELERCEAAAADR